MSIGVPPQQGPQGPYPYPQQGPYSPPGPYGAQPYGQPAIDPALQYIVPVNIRNGWAFASGYLGLFSLILGPVTGIPALITGVIGLRRPQLGNLGRAWTGVILGGITTVLWAIIILLAVMKA